MPNDSDQLLDVLRRIPYPGYSRDIVSLGVVRQVTLDGGSAEVVVDTSAVRPDVAEQLAREVRQRLLACEGVEAVHLRQASQKGSPSLKMVGSAAPSVAARGGLDNRLIPEVKHVIAIASGKGGVGKSTVAVNLAVALARSGARVGLLDADIYGPSIPLMFGLAGEHPVVDRERGRLQPFERYGVRVMSLGFLLDDADTAVIWRGPMVMKALEQLLGEVAWGALDVLVVDMPPGTGDAQLTMSQRVRLSGAVVVTTPQDVALADAVKGINMFRKVDVPLLGLVENMSYFVCPGCGERSEIFGHDGGRAGAERLGVPFLGHVPLDGTIRESGDRGRPISDLEPDSALGRAFSDIARQVLEALGPDEASSGDAEGGGLFDRFRKVWRDAGPGD